MIAQRDSREFYREALHFFALQMPQLQLLQLSNCRWLGLTIETGPGACFNTLGMI